MFDAIKKALEAGLYLDGTLIVTDENGNDFHISIRLNADGTFYFPNHNWPILQTP